METKISMGAENAMEVRQNNEKRSSELVRSILFIWFVYYVFCKLVSSLVKAGQGFSF